MSDLIPVAGHTYTFDAYVISQANTDVFQTNPTIAAGDFRRTINGGAFANLDNLPTVTPAGGKRIEVVLSATETTSAGAGGIVSVVASDQAGDEWQDNGWTVRIASADLVTTAVTDLLATAAALSTAQADLDNPSQYKADVSALATAAALATAQADLDNPSQYKADVSALATAAALAVADANIDILIARLTAARAGYLDALSTGVPVGEILTAALADMFNTDSGDTYSGSVSGSVVKEIVDNLPTAAEILALILANAGSVSSSITTSTGTEYRGDTWSIDIDGLGDLTGYVSIDFTIKENKADADTAAILRIRKNASGTDDGLMRLNGAAAATPGNASITIDDLTDGDITVALSADESKNLAPDDTLYADIQVIKATGVDTLREYEWEIAADVTRLTS